MYDRPVPQVKQQTKYTVFLLVSAGLTLALCASLIRKKSLQWSFTSTNAWKSKHRHFP